MYNNIYTALCEKLEEYDRRGEMSAKDLECIHILTDTIKNLDKIERLNEDSRGESYRNYYDESARNYRGAYDDGMSSRTRVSGYYRNSRNRRNSYDGGMSNDSYRGSYYRDGNYADDSYAETVEQLKMLMQIADDKEKKALKNAISQIEIGK